MLHFPGPDLKASLPPHPAQPAECQNTRQLRLNPHQHWKTSPSHCLRCDSILIMISQVICILLKVNWLSLVFPEGQPARCLWECGKWKDITDFQHFGTGCFLFCVFVLFCYFVLFLYSFLLFIFVHSFVICMRWEDRTRTLRIQWM